MPDKHKQNPQTLLTFFCTVRFTAITASVGGSSNTVHDVLNSLFLLWGGLRDLTKPFHALLQHFRGVTGLASGFSGYDALSPQCHWCLSISSQPFLSSTFVPFYFTSPFSWPITSQRWPQATNNWECSCSLRQLIIWPLHNWSRAITDS